MEWGEKAKRREREKEDELASCTQRKNEKSAIVFPTSDEFRLRLWFPDRSSCGAFLQWHCTE